MEKKLRDRAHRARFEAFEAQRLEAARTTAADYPIPADTKEDELGYLHSTSRARAFIAYAIDGQAYDRRAAHADERNFPKELAATLWAARRIYARAGDSSDPDHERRTIAAVCAHALRTLYPEDPYPWPLIAYHVGISHDLALMAAQRVKRMFLRPGGTSRWEEFLALRTSFARA